VEPQDGLEVHVGEDIAVHHDHSFAEGALGVFDRAARPEGGLFENVGEADAVVRAIAQHGADALRAEGHAQDDVDDSRFAEQIELELEEGPIEDRNHGFRQFQGQGAEPCALASDQDDRARLHRGAELITEDWRCLIQFVRRLDAG
jgi:hypothetical protein